MFAVQRCHSVFVVKQLTRPCDQWRGVTSKPFPPKSPRPAQEKVREKRLHTSCETGTRHATSGRSAPWLVRVLALPYTIRRLRSLGTPILALALNPERSPEGRIEGGSCFLRPVTQVRQERSGNTDQDWHQKPRNSRFTGLISVPPLSVRIGAQYSVTARTLTSR